MMRLGRRVILLGSVVLAGGGTAATARADLTSPIAMARDTVPANFCGVVRQDLLDGEFTQLEATVKAARTLEPRFDGGQTELEVFYGALADTSCAPSANCKDDATGDARQRRIQEWLNRKSDPATASLAMALLWRRSAWQARGCGFASGVSQDQWKVFFDRLKISADYARQIDMKTDPEAGHFLIELGRDFNLPRDQLDDIFKQAHSRFPTYFSDYQAYGVLALQKWSSRSDLLAPFVASLSSDPGGETGDVAYAFVAERLLYEFKPDRLYTDDTGFEWQRMRQAFATREKLYGLNARGWTALCYLAYVAQDRETARSAFGHLGGSVASWPSGTDAFYHDVLPWIRQTDGENPSPSQP